MRYKEWIDLVKGIDSRCYGNSPKAKTWDDVYKDLKVRVTMESVHRTKKEISEESCEIIVKAIKDMLKKEFGERWGHHISSTYRFIVR